MRETKFRGWDKKRGKCSVYRWVDYVREIIGNIHETTEILKEDD